MDPATFNRPTAPINGAELSNIEEFKMEEAIDPWRGLFCSGQKFQGHAWDGQDKDKIPSLPRFSVLLEKSTDC